jgi:LPXTG-site transpeptidase (sortase) family protein
VAALLGALLTAQLLPDRSGSDGFTAGVPEATQLPDEQPADQPREATARHRATTSSSVSAAAVPRRLTITRLGLRMPVVARGVDDGGAMALPASAFTVAWYRFGSRPLDDAGATVLAGHVDTRAEGVGPLSGLAALRVGDLISLRAGRHDVTYRTTSVTRISKALIDLPAVFSRSGAPRLHLVTCGGPYLPDRGGYQDNVVVSARRVSPPR